MGLFNPASPFSREKVPFKRESALDFSQVPPLALKSGSYGRMPLPRDPAFEVDFVNGEPFVKGVPLAPSNRKVSESLINRRVNEQVISQPVVNRAGYGDVIAIPIAFAATGERMVLPRPNNIRTLLTVQNLNVVGGIGYAFDRQADNFSCIQIPAGGNRIFSDAVPQGDLHIFAAAAGNVVVEFMNKDIERA